METAFHAMMDINYKVENVIKLIRIFGNLRTLYVLNGDLTVSVTNVPPEHIKINKEYVFKLIRTVTIFQANLASVWVALVDIHWKMGNAFNKKQITKWKIHFVPNGKSQDV